MEQSAPVTGGPCWAELGTTDPESARRFYTRLFGWRPGTDPRQEPGGCTVAYLGDAAVAALAPLYQESQPVAWNVSFAVADVEAALRAVGAAGGQALLGPTDVFDAGRSAVAVDPTGAVFQLWQADAFPGAGVFGVPGSLGWVELMTRAPRQAVSFYTGVFGWSVDASRRYPQWSAGGADFGGMVTMDEKFPHEVPAHWLPYFAVDDVDDAAVTTTTVGGTVLMEPVSHPEGPRIAVLRDPQGAMFGVYRAADGW